MQAGLQHFTRTGYVDHGGHLRGCGIKIAGSGCGCPAVCGGILGGSHIQHDIRRGKGTFQLRHSGGGIAGQCAHAIGIGGAVPLLRQGGVLLRHQKFQCLQGRVAHGFGYRAFNAALLDAGIHNFAGVVGQAQVAVGLRKQQHHHGDARRPVTTQLFKDLYHRGFLLLSGFAPVLRFLPQWQRERRPSLPAFGQDRPVKCGSKCGQDTH